MPRQTKADKDAEIASLTAENERLRKAAQAALLFFRSEPWFKTEEEWERVTGGIPPTSKGLCDFIRSALAVYGPAPDGNGSLLVEQYAKTLPVADDR